jgi:hypothetical protein
MPTKRRHAASNSSSLRSSNRRVAQTGTVIGHEPPLVILTENAPERTVTASELRPFSGCLRALFAAPAPSFLADSNEVEQCLYGCSQLTGEYQR